MIEFPCSAQQLASLKEIAVSTTRSVWQIKRAKIILGFHAGKTVTQLVRGTRVPPETIEKVLARFLREGMDLFQSPNRKPTSRETRVERMLAFLNSPLDQDARAWEELSVHYIGKDFSAREIAIIRKIIEACPGAGTISHAKTMCQELDILDSRGNYKTTAIDILKRMDMDNIVRLPAINRLGRKRKSTKPRSHLQAFCPPPRQVLLESGDIQDLRFMVATTKEDLDLWRHLIKNYHYLEESRVMGRRICYLVFATISAPLEQNFGERNDRIHSKNQHEDEVLVGLLSFSSGAWQIRSRDRFIGWNKEERIANLTCVLSNTRFLIPPWLSAPNLASRILGGIVNKLTKDWQEKYDCRPWLLETFVQLDRNEGTCYKAANWVQVGITQGYSHSSKTKKTIPKKAIFLYPLHRKFRTRLCRSATF